MTKLLTRFSSAFRAFASPQEDISPKQADALLREIAQANPLELFDKFGTRPFNPSLLVSRKGLLIFNEMREDDQVKAALKFKKLAAIKTGWQIKSPEGKDTKDERGQTTKTWEVTEFVDWDFRQFLGRQQAPAISLENILEQIMSRADFGYSISEKVYAPIEMGRWKGNLGLAHLKTRAPDSFDFDVDKFGNLDRLLQEQDRADLVPLPPEKFVIAVNEFEWGNFYGTADLEAAYRPWWAKKNAYKWYLMLLEKLGIPPIFLFYDPNALDKVSKTNIQKILKRLQAGTTATIPVVKGKDSAWMQFLPTAKEAGEALLAAIDLFDKHIARALLMPGLLGFTPDEQQGSFARAKVSFDVFMLVIENDRTDISTNIMDSQTIPELVDLNFGVQEEYPFFEFNPITGEDRQSLMESWKVAVDTGTIKTQESDEVWARQLHEAPEIEEDREEEEPEPPPAPFAPGSAPPAPGGEDEGARPEDGAQGGTPSRPPIPSRSRAQSFARSREPNKFEKHVNFQRIDRSLDGIEAKGVAAGTEALTETQDILIRQVERKGDAIDNTFIADLMLMRRPALEEAFTEMMISSNERGRVELRSEIPKRFALPNFRPRDALAFLAARGLELSRSVHDRLLTEVKRILQRKIEQGLTVRATVGLLREAFEPFIGNASVLRGGEPIPDFRLEAIARTESTNAFNQGRLVEARDDDLKGFMQGMMFSAILDSRTTEVCTFLDGRIFRMDDPEMDTLRPSRHVNCRSILVPVTIATEVEESEFVTPSQAGRGKELSGRGF